MKAPHILSCIWGKLWSDWSSGKEIALWKQVQYVIFKSLSRHHSIFLLEVSDEVQMPLYSVQLVVNRY